MAQNLNTFSKHEACFLFMFADRHVCFPQTCKCRFILCQQEALLYIGFHGNGRDPITVSAALTNAALQERQEENEIELF